MVRMKLTDLQTMARLLTMTTLLTTLAGCAMVQVDSITAKEYVSSRRGDVLTTGLLSSAARSDLQVVGLDETLCFKQLDLCREAVLGNLGLNDEQRMSTLSELWLLEAVSKEQEQKLSPADEALQNATLNAHLESARYAYAYLFHTPRTPEARALEDRQAQVRDYFNFATQQAVVGLFNRYKTELEQSAPQDGYYSASFGPWTIRGKLIGISQSHQGEFPQELVTASALSFEGVRNQYRRDGIGAELVAVFAKRVVSQKDADTPWSETPFPALTMLLRFEGETLAEVLNTRRVEFQSFDPHKTDSISIKGAHVPLAANFTAGYGLWLARSGFAQQSLLTLIGRGEALEKPRIYLMQPYDPNQRVLLMLHGLASSPEAWVNVANELLGDTTIRQNYQIWQVYYPTNLPMAFNNRAIRDALTDTLKHFDPKGQHQASRDMVLLGHSMGGVIARLMVSSTGDQLWEGLLEPHKLADARKKALREKVGPLLVFEPMPQVSRAVFVAAPHRGTDFADNRFARLVSSLIKLPANVFGRVTEIAQLLVDPESAAPAALTRPLNSINNLSDQDPFVQQVASLPISPKVKYHSIIGNDTPGLDLSSSSDGVVPYKSAHLDGAESELVVPSWHSVQEHPAAIVEVRRILREHLKGKP